MASFGARLPEGDHIDNITLDMADAAQIIWNDSHVQKAFLRRNEFQIQDTAEL